MRHALGSQHYRHLIDFTYIIKVVVPDLALCYLPLLDSGLHTDYVPNDEETKALSRFLSELSLTDVDENEISLSSENMPEEFHLVYNRRCKRTQYEISPGFTIILSKERSWRSDAITEETRESVVILLLCFLQVQWVILYLFRCSG